MNIRELVSDDDAVSPVIGVILMVAITVILAAVIGTFVLGLGGSVSQQAPQASFTFDLTSDSYTDGTNNVNLQTVEFVHDGGDSIEKSNLDVTVGGNPVVGIDGSGNWIAPFSSASSTLEAGSSGFGAAVYTGSGTPTSGSLTVDTSTSPNSIDNGDYGPIESGDTVRVVWNSPESDTTATIGRFEVN